MEIIFNQQVYPSGTIDISCRYYTKNAAGMQWLQSEFGVCKLRSTYKFKYSTKYFSSYDPEQLEVTIDPDLVLSPKNLEDEDWQLLKILHPAVKYFQWEVFQTLKDFVDNKIDEEIAINLIKNILEVS